MIPAHIFREYDIRGLHETELTDATAEAVGRAFGTLVTREGGSRVSLGRDVRPSSERLVAANERGLRSAGAHVDRVGVVPTPANEVCRRPWLSNGEMRTRRCVPCSTESVPYA